MYSHTRILLADHHELFVDGIAALLKQQTSVELMILSSSDLSLQEAIVVHQPAIILIDAQFPNLSIAQLADYLKQNSFDSKLVVFSLILNDAILIEALSSGIAGFLLKTCTKQEVLNALVAVSSGHSFYCTATTNRLQQLIVDGRYHPHKKINHIVLSDKEKNILQLICAEYTSKEIADQLNMSLRTVEAYRQSLQEKTGSKNSAGLILYAIRNGIVALEAS